MVLLQMQAFQRQMEVKLIYALAGFNLLILLGKFYVKWSVAND